MKRVRAVAVLMSTTVVVLSTVVLTVFAASGGISSGATATETAHRSAEQIVINPPPAAPTARYRITIDIAFDSSTHPGTAPGNAHVSSPIIATHRTQGSMFTVGAFATSGIESMAELGRTSTLVAELNANPDVTSVQVSSGVTGIGTRTVDVDLTPATDMVSMVTMLAPSPDWFIGFADLDLLGPGGWVTSVSFPLGNYDAGTDSGSKFTSGNIDTQPRQPVSGPRDPAFVAAAGQNSFGSVTVTRIG